MLRKGWWLELPGGSAHNGGMNRKILRWAVQVLGVLLLLPAVTLATLRIENSNDDGASIVFPGGELVAGEMHAGPEPDWSFTDEVMTIDLQLFDPPSSRRVWIVEADGRIFVTSGYMNSFLGRLWKDWAVRVDAGENEAVIRVDGMLYERVLERIETGPILEEFAAKVRSKYNADTTRQTIEDGDSWVFELLPPPEERVVAQ